LVVKRREPISSTGEEIKPLSSPLAQKPLRSGTSLRLFKARSYFHQQAEIGGKFSATFI
jgi:hypothetical protein